MEKLIKGLHHFQSEIFGSQKDLYESLATHQNPDTLFITCSDSRISPNLITQTDPGELFVVRNAGNIVPAHNEAGGGEAATIEYAVSVLGVRDIIICGHSNCGAMKGLLDPDGLNELPVVASWLRHSDAVSRIIRENYKHLSDDGRLNVAVQENVLTQIEHLKTLPSVAARLGAGKLNITGWVYKIHTGQIFQFDPNLGQFCEISGAEAARPVLARAKRRTVGEL